MTDVTPLPARPMDPFRQAMLKTALDTTPLLTEENYGVWKDKMTAILELRGLLNTLEDANRSLFPDDDTELRLLILSKMDTLTHNNVVTADNRNSAKALWRAIKDQFASLQSSNRARVFNSFLYLTFSEEDVGSFITEVRVGMKRLVEVGIELPDDVLAYLVLFKFPSSLQPLRQQLMHSDKPLTAAFVCDHLTQLDNEARAEKKDSTQEGDSSLLTTRSVRPQDSRSRPYAANRNARCTEGFHNPRQDRSHSSDDCWHLHPENAPDWWRGGKARKRQAKDDENYYISLLTLWIDSGSTSSRIIFDSGSSSHVFNDPVFFTDLQRGDFDSIKTGKRGAALPVKGKGTVRLRWGSRSLDLTDCLFVPELVVNLISPGVLDAKGCRFNSTEGMFQVSRDNQLVLNGVVKNNLYTVNNPTHVGSAPNEVHFTSPSTTLKLIHETYGHSSLNRLEPYLPRNIPHKAKESFQCKACIMAKITKQPFHEVSTLASKPFERIHLDLIGPISPISSGSHRYILTLVDNYSGYLAGFPLVRKSDTSKILISVIEQENRKRGYYPSMVCSDGGGEFTGKELVNYLDKRNIKRLISEPYHPEHNGRAERANRSITECLRATFNSSQISKQHWHVTLKACCIALNQIPKKGECQTPWFKLHGHELPSNFLKPLGTKVVFLNMTRAKGRKFDAKGIEGCLVGFNPSMLSYKILSQHNNRIIDSKHVRFLLNDNSQANLNNMTDTSTFDSSENNHLKSDTSDIEPISESQIPQIPSCEDSLENEDLPEEPNPQSTRTLRDRSTLKPPDRFGFHHYYEPNTFEKAYQCDDRGNWDLAVKKELQSIEDHNVWENHWEQPPNPLNTTWIFKIKDNCHGGPLKFKARLCVQGFNQIEGLDFDNTFAPTGKAATLRLLLLYALDKKKQIRQFDVQGAFLHAPLDEDVYIVNPKGCPRESPYLKLKKSLYGLKQAPRNWYRTLTAWFEEQGFFESDTDPCLYKTKDGESILFFHVDDMIIVGFGDDFESKFKDRFPNSSSHEPNTILGLKFERGENRIFLSQPNHIQHGLEELGLTNCRPSYVPRTPNKNLLNATDEEHEAFKKLNINYRSAIGLLNYISMNTRPDLSFAVSSLARYSTRPGIQHWHEVRKCWQYLNYTKHMRLTLQVKNRNQLLEIYSDSTWGDDPETRTSQSGYACYLFGSIISWHSGRQRNVTYSSTEAELNPLVDSFQEGIWLKAAIEEIWGKPLASPDHFIDDPQLEHSLKSDQDDTASTTHFIDNKGLSDKLIKFGSNPKTRHIDLKTKGLRQEIRANNINIQLIKTEEMLADTLTKATPVPTLKKFVYSFDPDFATTIH